MNWKNIFKSWTGVPVLVLVVLAIIVWGVPFLMGTYTEWKIQNEYEKLAEPYYNDTYGGATPEETYDLFIEALKDGDVELASKYFVVEKQDNWLRTLKKYSQGGYLGNFLEELENTKNNWSRIEANNPEMAVFRYQSLFEEDTETEFEGQKIIIPAGNYTNETMFIKYPSGVWKIEGI